VRWSLFALALLVSFSCREITPFESLTGISGYELDGIVTTKDGRPIDSVTVRVNYFYRLVQQTPLDTQRLSVSDSTHSILIAVYTPAGARVRTVYSGHLPLGTFPHYFWDERDDSGRFAPSGKYFLRYAESGTVLKSVPWLADGHITTSTNVAGQFTLSGTEIPAGEVFDLYYYNGSYDGTYMVQPKVHLELNRGALRAVADEVDLQTDYITRGSFIVQ
jgi:hypothetical protein